MNLNGIPPVSSGQVPVQVDLTKASQMFCKCGCRYFTTAVKVYTVSALMSPTGRELPVQVPVLLCMECKAALPVGKQEG